MESKLTKLAFYSTVLGRTYLIRNDLKKMIDETIKTSPKTKDLPLSVFAVFGSSNMFDSVLLTDWLHQYLLAKQKNKVADSNMQIHRTDYYQQGVLTDGVYFWPNFFEIKENKTGQKMLCLLLHVQGTRQENSQFVASVCSNAICVSRDIGDLFKTAAKTNVGYLVKQTAVDFPVDEVKAALKQDAPNNEIQTKKLLFEAIDKYPLSIKKVSENNILTVKSFIPYLEKIQEMLLFNNEQISSKPDPLAHTMNLYEYPEETFEQNPVLRSKTNKTNQGRMDVIRKAAVRVGVNFLQNWSGISRSTCSLCTKRRCTDLQKQVSFSVLKWLQNQGSPWKLLELEMHVRQFKHQDNHYFFGELEFAFKAIGAYLGEVQNIFDSHICFCDSRSMDLFNTVSNSAHKRSQNILQQCELVHSDFVNNLRQEACTNLHNTFLADNSIICEYEVELVSDVSDVAIRMYEIQLRKILENPESSPEILEAANSRLKRYTSQFMVYCLEYGNRLNPVQTEVNKKMQDLMHQTYKKLEVDFFVGQFPQKETPYSISITMYQKMLRKIYENPFKFERDQIMHHHQNTVSKIVSRLSSSEEIVHILKGHLTHLMSVRQEMINNGSLKFTNTFCVRLTSHHLRIDMKVNSCYNIFTTNKQEWVPAFLACSKTAKFMYGFRAIDIFQNSKEHLDSYGYVKNYLNYPDNCIDHAKWMLTQYFVALKHSLERISYEQVLSTIFVVPAWFTVEHRMRIYDCAKKAGFLQTFVISDTAAAAFELFSCAENSSSLVIPTTISNACVEINIYQKSTKEKNGVLLIASAKLNLQHENGNQVLDTQRISHVFEKALEQLTPETRKMHKIVYKIRTSVDTSPLDKYIQRNNDIVLWNDEANNIPSRGAVRLSDNVNNIRKLILDYVRVSDQANTESSHSTNDADKYRTDQAVLSEKNSDLEKIQRKLLQRCSGIKAQMQEGKVRVRGVLKKAVNETLDKVEIAAASDIYTLEEFLEFEKELIELAKEHEFELE